MSRVGLWSNTLQREQGPLKPSLEFLSPLRGVKPDAREQRAQEDAESVAGLRRSVGAVRRLPRVQSVGRMVRRALSAHLDENPQLERQLLELLVNQEGAVQPEALNEAQVSHVRARLGRAFSVEDASPTTSETCTTSVVGSLLLRWAQVARDPGSHTALWCWEGAPAGLLNDPNVTAIFPTVEDWQQTGSVDELSFHGTLRRHTLG